MSTITKRAYRFLSGDVAGNDNAKVLCFSLVDGTKYYVAYDGSNGAWSDTTGVLLQGSNVYASTNTSGTAVSTISGGTDGFVVASLSCSIDGANTLLESGKTFAQLGYSAIYSQETYDSSRNESPSTFLVDINSYPYEDAQYYTDCIDVF